METYPIQQYFQLKFAKVFFFFFSVRWKTLCPPFRPTSLQVRWLPTCNTFNSNNSVQGDMMLSHRSSSDRFRSLPCFLFVNIHASRWCFGQHNHALDTAVNTQGVKAVLSQWGSLIWAIIWLLGLHLKHRQHELHSVTPRLFLFFS